MKKHSQFKDGSINVFDGINLIIRRKNIKNLIIKINRKNEIEVSVPNKLNDENIIIFLKKHLKRFDKYRKERELNKPINEIENWFYLFGQKKYFLDDQNSKKIIINNYKISYLNKQKIEAIDFYRKKELIQYLANKQIFLEKLMNIEPHKIKIRKKRNAWATNHVLKKIIYYSINLSSFDKEIIDYVIIHELAHNKFPNHSPEFWNLIKKYEPNFKIKKLKLKNNIYY